MGDGPTNFLLREGFHREFAEVARERGWARLWLMHVDDQPVAAWYGFRFEGADCYYQMGRDRNWDHARVGFVLLAHSIRESIADGMQEYRFLRGGEEYKYRFANIDPGLESIVVSHGPVGAAGLAAARTSLAVRRFSRRARARRGLLAPRKRATRRAFASSVRPAATSIPCAARRLHSSRSETSSRIAVTSASTSEGGTSRPASPCSSVAGTPPTAVATTGVPLPSASITVAGTPSVSDTWTKTCARR